MKAYKIEIEELSADWGRFIGWKTIKYCTNKIKAEKIAKNLYENRCYMVEGKTRITEIEIEE